MMNHVKNFMDCNNLNFEQEFEVFNKNNNSVGTFKFSNNFVLLRCYEGFNPSQGNYDTLFKMLKGDYRIDMFGLNRCIFYFIKNITYDPFKGFEYSIGANTYDNTDKNHQELKSTGNFFKAHEPAHSVASKCINKFLEIDLPFIKFKGGL